MTEFFLRIATTAAWFAMVPAGATWCRAADTARGPADLHLASASPFDGSQQPYRLYLPSAYDGSPPLPLLVALHGTGGDQNKYFDHETGDVGDDCVCSGKREAPQGKPAASFSRLTSRRQPLSAVTTSLTARCNRVGGFHF